MILDSINMVLHMVHSFSLNNLRSTLLQTSLDIGNTLIKQWNHSNDFTKLALIGTISLFTSTILPTHEIKKHLTKDKFVVAKIAEEIIKDPLQDDTALFTETPYITKQDNLDIVEKFLETTQEVTSNILDTTTEAISNSWKPWIDFVSPLTKGELYRYFEENDTNLSEEQIDYLSGFVKHDTWVDTTTIHNMNAVLVDFSEHYHDFA